MKAFDLEQIFVFACVAAVLDRLCPGSYAGDRRVWLARCDLGDPARWEPVEVGELCRN